MSMPTPTHPTASSRPTMPRARARPPAVSPTAAAFYLQVSIILFFLAGSSAPTPLYSVYQAAWGFSPITITAVFGVYALAVLAALLVFGSLSDHIGRRPVLLVTALRPGGRDGDLRVGARRRRAGGRARGPGAGDRRGGRRRRRRACSISTAPRGRSRTRSAR